MEYYTYINSPHEHEEEVGNLWGLDILSVKPFFYDNKIQKYYIIDYTDGMCGIEEKLTYFDAIKNEVVEIGEYKYSVRFSSDYQKK